MSYWSDRSGHLYYQAVRDLVHGVAAGATSILDVGSNGCPYLDWFPEIPKRVSLDLENPYAAPGVESIKADFLDWQRSERFSIVICLQVLEHVPDAKSFAQKLLAVGSILVVSVPYKWAAGICKQHVHDPVDEEKMRAWFGRYPNYQNMIREISDGTTRLIHVYEPHTMRWGSLAQRKSLIASGLFV